MVGSGPGLAAPARPTAVSWLRSQGLGVLCGQATVLLFAIGSVVLGATRDDASADIKMDEIRGFITTPSVVHTWFYLLVAVVALFALNLLLCTWDTVVSRVKAGRWMPSVYAASLVHVGVLVALAAHLVGGLWSREEGQVVVGEEFSALGDGRLARLVALRIEPQADGSPKSVQATLELRSEAQELSTEVLGYNEPLSAGLGSELILLVRPLVAPGARGGMRGDAVLLRRRVAPGNPLGLFAALLMAMGITLMWRRVI
jgi:hypothetical protein